MKLTSRPNCKINLGLNIISRRLDGYHNLETIFYPIPLLDTLTIEWGEETTKDHLTVRGIPVEGRAEDNLVVRVANMLREEGLNIPPLHITLHKNIPSGAGLGGGSSDAAFMMKMLQEAFSLPLSTEDMEERVARLGADCAFFIKNKPVFAEGIGNIFTPITLDLSGWHLLLIKPNDFVSTRDAYKGCCPKEPNIHLNNIVNENVTAWKDIMVNDFEQTVFPLHPVIEIIRDWMYDNGAVYASMSGSGSSVFGLFRDIPPAVPEKDSLFSFSCTL